MRKPRQPPSKTGEGPAPLDPESARGRALKLLSRREHSAAELAAKLQRRGADASVARDAVQTMAAAGWQSDERYAEMLVRNRIEQGYGPLRIRMELTQAGVPDAEIRTALETADVDWAARCVAVCQRKFKKMPSGAGEWQKQYRFLASHGFTAAQIRVALKSALGVDEVDVDDSDF